MVQGAEVTEQEKQFIHANKDSKFPSQIAKELSTKYEPFNGGYRSVETVRKVLKNQI